MRILALSFCLAAAALAAPGGRGQPMEIGRFGALTTWTGDGTPARFANLAAASATGRANLGIEWRDERDVHEVRVRFERPAPRGLALEYWFGTWPPPPPKMPTIEDPSDDPWQGKWLAAKAATKCGGPECRFTFQPLAKAENELANNLPGVRYRRTLKVRLVADTDLPAIRSLEVYSDSVERPLTIRVRLEWVSTSRSNGPVPCPYRTVTFAAPVHSGSPAATVSRTQRSGRSPVPGYRKAF